MTRARDAVAQAAYTVAVIIAAPVIIAVAVAVAVRIAWQNRKSTTKGTK